MTLEMRMHEACSQLRFAEGLRRRAAEARAETSVNEAVALARLEGARIQPAVLRVEALSWNNDRLKAVPPDLAVGLAAWRASWSVIAELADLNPKVPTLNQSLPLRSVMARIHRDYASVLATHGLANPDKIAIARDPERLSQILAAASEPGQNAVLRAARLWALMVIDEPFEVGNSVVGILGAKFLLAQDGVEPTGVSVLTLRAATRQGEYQQALGAARGGDWDSWVEFVQKSVIGGCDEGTKITRRVQAGRLA